jgi:hypothetical protein
MRFAHGGLDIGTRSGRALLAASLAGRYRFGKTARR